MALARFVRLGLATGLALLGANAFAQSTARVDTKRLLNADKEAGQWMSHSRTYDEQYFSPLKRINDGNVDKLGLAWFVDLPTNQNVESSPLMIDGVIYLTLPWSKVMALDAKTGKQLWLHDPKVATAWNINICCGVDNRGAAAWNGKIIFGTLDGRLIALDARTGTEVVHQGHPERAALLHHRRAAHRQRQDLHRLGRREFDARGYVDAYDAETGKQLWRFWTIPGDPPRVSRTRRSRWRRPPGRHRDGGAPAAAAPCGTPSPTIR